MAVSGKIGVLFPAYGHATGRKPHYRPIVGYSVPQGPIYLATAVRRLGYDVRVVDGNFTNDAIGELLRYGPDKILITSTTAALQSTIAAVRELRSSGYRGEIFVGGPHASLNLGARDWLLPMREDVHYVRTVRGSSLFDWVPKVFEGESEVLALGPPRDDSAAVCERRRRNVERGREFAEFMPDVELVRDIYAPDEEWHAIHRSGRRVKLGTSLLTANGCTEGCTFCANPFMYRLSFLGADAVEEAVSRLKRIGVRHLGITDMYFMMNPRHAAMVGETLRRYEIPFSIQTCLESLSEPVLDQLVEHGCKSMLIGIENPASHTLTKHVDLDDVTWLMDKAVAERRLTVKLSYIVGLPGANVTSDVELIEHIQRRVLARGHPTDNVQCNIYTPYRPDPDTRYAPYQAGAPPEAGVEYILDRVPFSYWGIFPISLCEPDDLATRMMLCDMVSTKVFTGWHEIYAQLRRQFCEHLEEAYPELLPHVPTVQGSAELYERLRGRAALSA